MKLLAADPLAHYLAHQVEIDTAIQRVLHSGQYILGPEVTAFEEEFAGYLGVGHGIGVGNGTEAIHLALRAANIGPGDQVIAPSHTAVATVAAIEMAGAEPLLVDIDPGTYTLDPDKVRRAINPRVRAIIAVHLYGQACDLGDVARQYQLCLVEDCAQSHGATLSGKKTGTLGRLAAFSFYPTKNLAALGDGGAVVTDDPALAGRLRQLREYGWRQRHVSEFAGGNSRLDELQAAVLRVNLKYLDADNQRRRDIARQYTRAIQGTKLTPPQTHPGHVFHQYVIRSREREGLRAHLQSCGVPTLIHYPVPIHQQPAYRGRLAIGPDGLACTEASGPEILSLPMHPHLTDPQVQQISDALLSWTGQ